MILAGLWCSTEKPQMHMFLKPIVEMLVSLESKGQLISRKKKHKTAMLTH